MKDIKISFIYWVYELINQGYKVIFFLMGIRKYMKLCFNEFLVILVIYENCICFYDF